MHFFEEATDPFPPFISMHEQELCLARRDKRGDFPAPKIVNFIVVAIRFVTIGIRDTCMQR